MHYKENSNSVVDFNKAIFKLLTEGFKTNVYDFFFFFVILNGSLKTGYFAMSI